jgi:hypothetical protein
VSSSSAAGAFALGFTPASQASVSGALTESVTFAGSGIVFNNTFTANVSQAYKNAILAAEQDIASHWTNSITLNLKFDAQAEGTNTFLATNSWSGLHVAYAALKGALTTLASHESGNSILQQAVAHLPTTDPSGGAGFGVSLAYARLLGLSASTGNPDDTVTLNTSFNWTFGQDVINAVEHEISEGGMGRVGGLGDQNHDWAPMDLFRYTSSGVADFTDGRDGKTTFFSFNGGTTHSTLSYNNEFNSSGTKVNGDDTADFTQLDVFGVGHTAETNTLSLTDLQVMAALGWNPASQPGTLVASQITSIYQAVLARNPSQSESNTALSLDAASGDAAVVTSVVNSSEGQTNVYPVVQIIKLALGNMPNATQLAGWVPFVGSNGLLQGNPQINPLLDQMAEAFVASTNFGNVYNSGKLVDPNSPVAAHEMQVLIQAATGVAATQNQINTWVATGLTIDHVFVEFALGDQYTVASKAAVQQYLTAAADNAAGIPVGGMLVAGISADLLHS